MQNKEVNMLYLDLMKRCLTNMIYIEHEFREVEPKNFLDRTILSILEILLKEKKCQNIF